VRKTIRQFAPVVVNNETGSEIKTVKMVISNVILKVKVYHSEFLPKVVIIQ
jgi:hypothetical protein